MDGQAYDYGLWGMVALNVVIFGAFAIGLLRPRRTVEWRSLGVFSAGGHGGHGGHDHDDQTSDRKGKTHAQH